MFFIVWLATSAPSTVLCGGNMCKYSFLYGSIRHNKIGRGEREVQQPTGEGVG